MVVALGRHEPIDALEADNARLMNSHEHARIESALEHVQGFSRDESTIADVKFRAPAGGENVVDLRDADGAPLTLTIDRDVLDVIRVCFRIYLLRKEALVADERSIPVFSPCGGRHARRFRFAASDRRTPWLRMERSVGVERSPY